MANLVTSVGISELLAKLRDGEYLIPQFQRDFVWSPADVVALLNSIIDARPIGMITLWEQEDNSGLALEHISLPDLTEDDGAVVYFGKKDAKSNKFFAVLDGRQRSTAISMAFGGLRQTDARRKHAGQYYLNIAAEQPADRIIFLKQSDIENRGLEKIVNCISHALIPFKVDDEIGDLKKQWMAYGRYVENKDFYEDDKFPSSEERHRRLAAIDEAFSGITDTDIAVYTVPKKYDLGTICEVFETLNTTGTRVSTVDLIHSWLYADTSAGPTEPFLLRDWIRDLGQRDGAVGWASVDDRPELIAQFVTAAYLIERKPSAPRKIGGTTSPVASVKSGDLLATPTQHWLNIAGKRDEFAGYIGDFQRVVAGAKFAMRDCPYPISAAVYVALRWGNSVDGNGWGIDEIGSLFRAFFWRNALESRYDQGFLTKMTADLRLLANLLDTRKDYNSFGAWAEQCNAALEAADLVRPSREDIKDIILDAKPAGAIAKAVALPVLTRPRRDILDPAKPVEFGPATEAIELHHIFPKAWIRDNVKKDLLESMADEGRGGTNCSANMLPMLRTSNNTWKAKLPGNALSDAHVTLELHGEVLGSHYISAAAYKSLVQDKDFEGFWLERALLIAEDLHGRTIVRG